MESDDRAQSKTVERFIDRVAPTTSSREFLELMRRFPDEPALVRALADWLLHQRKESLAAKSYAKAAGLYLDNGKTIQAISARLMSWRLVKPDAGSARDFFLRLRKSRIRKSPASQFFPGLYYQELVALVSAITSVRVEPGHKIIKFGAIEDNLFFIVSGTVHSTQFIPMEIGGSAASGVTTPLFEDDYFGIRFPLEEESISMSFVKAVTPVELIRIPKTSLADICRKHPGVTRAMEALLESDNQPARSHLPGTRRRGGRHQIAIKVTIEIFPERENQIPLLLKGNSLDLGIGGLSVILEIGQPEGFPADIIGSEAKISISLADQTATISVLGKIVWARSMVLKGKERQIMGIQFKRLSPQVSGYLIAFAEIAKGSPPDLPQRPLEGTPNGAKQNGKK